jgi:uncharacterized protein (TIGR00255 family)
MRAAEGEVIRADLVPRVERLEKLRREIADLASGLPGELRRRFQERLSELMPGELPIDSARLEQEIALLAERADISEELVRLGGYVEDVRRTIGGTDTAAGRRLEFLLQEIHREINTVGSKSPDGEIVTRVVEFKLEIERIREQVQNVA